MSRLPHLVFAVATLLLTSLPAPAATRYRITDLGDFPGGSGFSYAYGINDAGQVVGASGIAGGAARAFRWTAGVGLENLGSLPGGTTYDNRAYGINTAGQVAGDGYFAGTIPRAFRWTAGGGMQNLGELPGGENYSYGRGINNAGQVVGLSGAATGPRAFVWTAGTGFQNLGDLPGGADYSFGNAINDNGQVVGGSFAPAGRRAFLWTAGGGMKDLGVLPGTNDSVASGINNAGQVVGYEDAGVYVPGHAFFWTAEGGMQDLGMLPGESDLTYYASGINDAGQVVGGTRRFIFSGGDHAILWTVSDGMKNLDALIDPLDPLKAVTRLLFAHDINNAGQIVGDALISGKNHAFLLTPSCGATTLPNCSTVPEPGCWPFLLAGLGWAGLIVMRRAL